MPAPTFSIVITTVDRPALLLDAVNSVLAQTCSDFELIVVNDGGPPQDTLLGQRDPRIVLLRLPGKSGPGRARNQGVAIARGRFIGFLDDDDLFHPDHLSTLLGVLGDAPHALVYSDAEVFHEVIEHGTRRLVNRATPWLHTLFIKQRLWVHNFIPVQTFAVSREAFLAVGGFDEELRAFEDWDLLLKLAASLDVIHIPRTTSEIRMRPDAGGHRSQTVKTDRSEPAIIEQLYARHGDLDDPLVRAGRERLRQGGFAHGPDFLIVDSTESGIAYQAWLAAHPAPRPTVPGSGPSLLFLITADADQAAWLSATLDSFAALSDSRHRLLILASEAVTANLNSPDPRIGCRAVESLDDFASLTIAFNAAIASHDCDWVSILPAGSTVDADLATQLSSLADQDVVYTDHDRIIHPQAIRTQPSFKPDFNPDLLAAEDYIGPALWARRQEILRLDGLLPFPGLWLQEILWRVVAQRGPAAVGHLADPLLHLPAGDRTPAIQQAARQALIEQQLARRQAAARVMPGILPDTLRLEYPLPTPAPLVSIIVSAPPDGADLLRCLASLLERTDYPAFEVLIAAPDDRRPSAARCQALGAARGIDLRAPQLPAGCSAAAARNRVAAAARGALFAFLAGNSEIVQPDWLSSLVRHALRPEVGAVGARLVGPDGKVAGGGLILGFGKGAGPAFGGQPYREPGYMNRLQLPQDLSAVSGRCLVVGSATFREAGGFAADEFPDRHADTDFCLRLRARGRLVVWNPEAVVADHGPAEERSATPALLQHWGALLDEDPAYNRHLSLSRSDFMVDPTRHPSSQP